MVRKDASTVKMSRVSEIRLEMLKSIKNGISIEKLLDWVELNIGLSREKAQEYSNLIIRSEGWVEVDGFVAYDLDSVEQLRRA